MSEEKRKVLASVLTVAMVLTSDCAANDPFEVTNGREVNLALIELSIPKKVKVPLLVTDRVGVADDVVTTAAILPDTVTVPLAPGSVAVRRMAAPELIPATIASLVKGELENWARVLEGLKAELTVF